MTLNVLNDCAYPIPRRVRVCGWDLEAIKKGAIIAIASRSHALWLCRSRNNVQENDHKNRGISSNWDFT